MSDFTTTARETIIDLLAKAGTLVTATEATENPRASQKLADRAIGYLNAAQTLLSAFAELHNELIECPEFIALRRFARKNVH